MSTVYSAVLPRSDGILSLPSIICQNYDVFDDHNDDEVHGTEGQDELNMVNMMNMIHCQRLIEPS